MSDAMDNLFASRVISNETCANLSNLAKAMEAKFQGMATDGAVLNAALDLIVSLHGDVLEECGGKRLPRGKAIVTMFGNC